MSIISTLENLMSAFSGFMWGTPLIILLVGGGFYFTIYSRFIPFRYFPHAIQILRGKYDDDDDPGQISHSPILGHSLYIRTRIRIHFCHC